MGMGMHPGSRIVPPGEWWKNPEVIQKLTLTEDQQKKMDGIFQQSRLQLIDLKANLEKQEVLLEPMLNANPPDSAKALAQIGKVADARAELRKDQRQDAPRHPQCSTPPTRGPNSRPANASTKTTDRQDPAAAAAPDTPGEAVTSTTPPRKPPNLKTTQLLSAQS